MIEAAPTVTPKSDAIWGSSESGWQIGAAAAYSVIILLILLVFSFIYIRVLNRSGQGSVV